MRINVFPLASSLHDQDKINENTRLLLGDLMRDNNVKFNATSLDELYDGDLALILIQSGGSEGLFLDNLSKLKEPYYLLTYGNNNSLAASLEILSYLKDNNLEGEVLHGSSEYIIDRVKELTKSEVKHRYGVVGKPSDWLIASGVNPDTVKRLHGVDLVEVSIDEIIDRYDRAVNDLDVHFDYDKTEVDKALRLHKVLCDVKDEYGLDGLTIRCFDLLGTVKTTACLSLALLNQAGIVATCEGDAPTMITMHILNKITGQTGFQANPSRIDVCGGRMVLAHCSLPLDMPIAYTLDTHFESGIGVAVRGKLKEDKITVFKLSKNLKDYFVTTGRIVRNLDEANLCRTQIEVELDGGIDYFLTRPYGNHHVVVYGDHKDEIVEYMSKIK